MGHVLLVDVEAQQAQASCGAAADAVQELQGLADQVVVVLVVLTGKADRQTNSQTEKQIGRG